MSKTTQRLVVLIFALALILPMGLVGIGQLTGRDSEDSVVADSAQDTRPTVDPSSQPTPENTVAPKLDQYSGMNAPTVEGARETTRYMFDTYGYMIATGDTAGWETFSAPECMECFAFATNSASLHADGGYIVGGDISITEQKVELATVGEAAEAGQAGAASDGGGEVDEAGRTATGASADPALASQPFARVEASYEEAPATLVDDPTREAVSRDGSSGTFVLTMRHDGERWLVTSMDVG